MYRWDQDAGTFKRQFKGTSSLALKYSIETIAWFLLLALPFILVLLLSIRFHMGWMRTPVRFYYVLNIFAIAGAILHAGVNFEWAALLLVFQYCCILISFKRFEPKDEKPVSDQ